MEIVEIETPDDKKIMEKFLEVGTKVYESDPVWVRQSEDIFLYKFRAAKSQQRIRMWPFIAIENGSPIARGAAIFDNRVQDESARPQGWIGFFESLRDYQKAATTVLQRCEERLRMAGAKSVLAPKVDDMILGLLIKGFGLPQTVLTNHNPPSISRYSKNMDIKLKRVCLLSTSREKRQNNAALGGLLLELERYLVVICLKKC